MTGIPEDVRQTLQRSVTNYLAADRAYHHLMQTLVERGTPLSTTDRAEVEELRQRRDYLLHVRLQDLRNIGWPNPHDRPAAAPGPESARRPVLGLQRTYEPRTPLTR